MAFIESGQSLDKEKHRKKMQRIMQNMNIVQYPLRIPAILHKKVKVKLASEGKSLREVLLDMLLNYIDKDEKS